MSEAPDSPSPTVPHPRGLYTLFFTEMWERFSYYGMRALLVLFMTAETSKGGLGFPPSLAGAVYGLYTAGVYLGALPGGWIADRLIGARRAVWCGGTIIAIGHFVLAIPGSKSFYLGLMLVAIGTGLLKPNVNVLVGGLYPEGGARRDAGFTIFYMGINIGATFGPLCCSWLSEKINWHLGFALAGIGMIGGLIQFGLTEHHLGDAGLPPAASKTTRWEWPVVIGTLVAGLLFVILLWNEIVIIDPVWIASRTAYVLAGLAVAFFGYVFLFGRLDTDETKRVAVIVILFISAALFFAGFEQQGSSFTLFALKFTQRTIGTWEIPTGWFQTINPIFVISLAPVVAGTWLWLAKRRCEPSLGMKFGISLFLMGAGFLVMMVAARGAINGPVSPSWLIFSFLLHTLAELCLSPVGLSSVTKLAPQRFVGQMLGLWFLATAIGNLIAGLAAGEAATEPAKLSALFQSVSFGAIAGGLLLFCLAWPMQKMMAGKE